MSNLIITRHWRIWLVGLIITVALLLRVRGFVTFPLEGDELYTFFEATHLFATNLQPGIEARPLYYLLQHALFWLGPDRHPAMLRALPLVFGVAGVWATWRLGREVSGSLAGGVAATMAAISPWHLYVSGMARYWSLVYLLACLAFWRLLVADRTDSRRDYLLVFGIIGAGLLAHPTFLFPLAGCAVGLHIHRGNDGWTWRWPSRSAVTGLWLPLIGLLAAEFVVLKLTGNSGAVRNWGGRSLLAVARLIPAMVQWMTPIVFVAGLLGTTIPLLNDTALESEVRWGLLSWSGLLSTCGLMLAAALMTNVYADYGLAALPLLLVSVGVLVETGARLAENRGRAFAGAALLVLVAGVAPSTASHLSDGMRFDYRPAFERIRRVAPDVPVYIPATVHVDWYAPGLDGRALQISSPWRPPELPEEGAWIVVGVRRYGIPGDPDGAVRRWLSVRCRLEDAWEGLRFDYRRYRVELHRCGVSS